MQKILFEGRTTTVYETDDLLTELPSGHSEFSDYAAFRPFIIGFIANCDAMIVSTDPLKQFYSQLNERIYTFNNTLEKSLWYQPIAKRRRLDSDRRQVTIGFCGSHTHHADLLSIESALERVQATFQDRVRFKFFGCITERLKGLPNSSYRTGFVKYHEYPALINSLGLDIGLAPLVDDAFNSHKSHIKYLEYSACGIAGVYSDVPAYNSTIVDGETGLLAGSAQDDWYRAISTLIESPAMTERIASRAYKDVWDRFSTESNAHYWKSIVEDIAAQTSTESHTEFLRRERVTRAMWDASLDCDSRISALNDQLRAAQLQLSLFRKRPIERFQCATKNFLSSLRRGSRRERN